MILIIVFMPPTQLRLLCDLVSANLWFFELQTVELADEPLDFEPPELPQRATKVGVESVFVADFRSRPLLETTVLSLVDFTTAGCGSSGAPR